MSIAELAEMGMIFPNPFSGTATFTSVVQKPQTAYLKVQNLLGQVVAQTKAFVQVGEQEFILSVNTAGIYLVSLTTEQGTASCKVICTETRIPVNSIQYLAPVPENHSNHNYHNNNSQLGLKSSRTRYTLGYNPGDIIHYRCTIGVYTSIFTDSPNSSNNYVVEFPDCTDPDDRTYSVVRIGNQTWMAENLAYLPSVSPSWSRSETFPYNYVYDYQGERIDEAKATLNFITYGVLYNWESAKSACPPGWHLPSDTEWTTLTTF